MSPFAYVAAGILLGVPAGVAIAYVRMSAQVRHAEQVADRAQKVLARVLAGLDDLNVAQRVVLTVFRDELAARFAQGVKR